jgi:hypothetical protein
MKVSKLINWLQESNLDADVRLTTVDEITSVEEIDSVFVATIPVLRISDSRELKIEDF